MKIKPLIGVVVLIAMGGGFLWAGCGSGDTEPLPATGGSGGPGGSGGAGGSAATGGDGGSTSDAGVCSDMTAQIAAALPLIQENSDGWYGYEYPYGMYHIAAGGEVWFLADPALVGATGNNFEVSIADPSQQMALVAFSYTIDGDNCLISGPDQLGNDRDWLAFGEIFTPLYGYPDGFPPGRKYLFDVRSSMQLGIAAQWQMYLQ